MPDPYGSGRRFRFGVTLAGSVEHLLDRVGAVADAGADLVMLPDHLGALAPIPTLVAAAQHAPRLRLATNVLNSSFYNPVLLARDLVAVDQLTDGRLEIGLGAGSVAREFETAGMEFPPAGRRVDHLTATVRRLRREFDDRDRETPPIMLGGSGNRVLTLAAREADVVAFAMLRDVDALADRTAFVRDRATDREDPPALCLSVFDLGLDREPDVGVLRFARPGVGDDELRRSPSLIGGSLDEVVAHLGRLRETYGITQLTLSQPSPEVLSDYGRVIARFRELDAAG